MKTYTKKVIYIIIIWLVTIILWPILVHLLFTTKWHDHQGEILYTAGLMGCTLGSLLLPIGSIILTGLTTEMR